MSNSEKKIPKLTPAMRAGLSLKILRGMKANPEFDKIVRESAEKARNKQINSSNSGSSEL